MSTMQLIVLGIAILFVVFVAIRIVVGVVKTMYAWAPAVVFLGALFALCYALSSEFRKDIGEVRAKYIESVKTESGYSPSGDKRNDNKVLSPTAPRRKGIKN